MPTDPVLPDALAVFRALANNAARWASVKLTSDGSEAQLFARVLEELAAVEEQEAGKRARAIDAWLTPCREAYQRHQALQDKRKVLERELRASRSSAEVEWLQLTARVLSNSKSLLRPPTRHGVH